MFEKLEQYLKNRTAIDQGTIELICKHFSLVQTKRNQFLLHQGEICKHYYFVNKGCLRHCKGVANWFQDQSKIILQNHQ